jgi:hypothetical protein
VRKRLLFPAPYTKEEFEQELLTFPSREAESRRELWTLCEVFQSIEDVGNRVPDYVLPMFETILDRPSDERAEGFRDLRNLLLEELAERGKTDPLRWQSRSNGRHRA